MSALLESISRDYSARIEAHGKMLGHLDLDPGADLAPSLENELRATLISCVKCHCPQRCQAWVDDRNNGAPPWCRSVEFFLKLEFAKAQLNRRRNVA